MQGNVFNRSAGLGTLNSAFASNNLQPFNQPFNEPGSAKTFGQNQQRGGFNAFDGAIGQTSNKALNFNQGGFTKLSEDEFVESGQDSPFNAAKKNDTPFWNPKPANNSLLDQAIGNGLNQPPINNFNQLPFAPNNFGQNPFGQLPATKHVSPFSKTSSTQSNRPSPFDQSIFSAHKPVFSSTEVRPAPSNQSCDTYTKLKVKRLSSRYERSAKAPINKRLGKAVENNQPILARALPKAKEPVTKPPVLKSTPTQPPLMPNKTTASLFLANDPGRSTPKNVPNDSDDLEKDAEGNIDPDKAVKKYRRSAGGEQPLPSDVRTPAALNVIDNILANNPVDKCHKFVRGRTRSIRQDFTLQNIRDLDAVATHERIARFHILSLHEMCEYDEGTFSLSQEMEQLHKTLISLMEYYDDLRDKGIETENEAKFRAQYITRALKFRALSQRNNENLETPSRHPGTSFLMACLLETHFFEVRKGALKAMNASYMMKAGDAQAEHVRQALAYDTIKQLFKEAMRYGIVIDNSLGEPTFSFDQKKYSKKSFAFKEPLSNPSQRKSFLLVEPKKADRTFRDIANGTNPLPNQNVLATQVNPLNPQAIVNEDATPVVNYRFSEITSPDDQQKEKENQYAEIKNQAALADELTEQERKKLELLLEKKKQLEYVHLEILRAEAESRKKEQLIKAEIMRKEDMEKERDREAQTSSIT
ncbi:hypothetical protein INT48_005520 [Thamnidium elegans]|uniref:SAC3/GANP/THP3 conserved domain-containing protein n=1 Tax=Thamnidium elegans TaxID=101142 RepID=A0A8H7VZU6_9FUNG|nr:hypothetical protein INT48_005520 [Thamnidium elegans]